MAKDKGDRTTPFGRLWLVVLAAARIFVWIPSAPQSLLHELVGLLLSQIHSQLTTPVTGDRELPFTQIILSSLVIVFFLMHENILN